MGQKSRTSNSPRPTSTSPTEDATLSRPDKSLVSKFLTPSEVQSLRENKKAAVEYFHNEFKKLDAGST